jgi:hypothetical protein
MLLSHSEVRVQRNHAKNPSRKTVNEIQRIQMGFIWVSASQELAFQGFVECAGNKPSRRSFDFSAEDSRVAVLSLMTV